MTTLRIGGKAALFAEPASTDALIELLIDCVRSGVPYRILGRGSNLFVRGEVGEAIVIRTTRLTQCLEMDGTVVRADAGVSLQRLLNGAAVRGLTGCEYLISVPGNVGGAVYMNAGRGRQANRSIADHVVRVEWFDGKCLRTFSRRQCRFRYRYSIFHDTPTPVIVAATLELKQATPERVQELLRERLEFVKQTQDNTSPNAGTVFSDNFALGNQLKGLTRNMAAFSSKTPNWILNHGGSSSTDVQALIDEAIQAHAARRLATPKLEWTVW